MFECLFVVLTIIGACFFYREYRPHWEAKKRRAKSGQKSAPLVHSCGVNVWGDLESYDKD